MELIKELGRRIQKARKEKGLTQQELAALSHVSLKHVQGCERGVKNPSFEVLRAFCKVLNLSLDSLMNLDLPEDEQAANDMRQLYLPEIHGQCIVSQQRTSQQIANANNVLDGFHCL